MTPPSELVYIQGRLHRICDGSGQGVGTITASRDAAIMVHCAACDAREAYDTIHLNGGPLTMPRHLRPFTLLELHALLQNAVSSQTYVCPWAECKQSVAEADVLTWVQRDGGSTEIHSHLLTVVEKHQTIGQLQERQRLRQLVHGEEDHAFNWRAYPA